MTEMDPQSRLSYRKDLTPVLHRACQAYRLGEFDGYSVLSVGYEDFNAILTTAKGVYVAKVFADVRNQADIDRYSTIMTAVAGSDINHPRLFKAGS